MGAPARRRIWARKTLDAVFLGTFKDVAGTEALFFFDPATGGAIGPLNLRLADADPGYSIAAPSVGATPDVPLGARGKVEFYVIAWSPARSGGPRSLQEGVRGTYLEFVPSPAPAEPMLLREILESARDPFTKALILGKASGPEAARARAELDALTEEFEIQAALHGFLISRNAADGLRTFELKVRNNPDWYLGPNFAGFRYEFALLADGLAGLGRAVPCDHSRDEHCEFLGALVGPAKSWAEGRGESVPQEIRESLLKHPFSGLGIFPDGRPHRPTEGYIEPQDGPFLFYADTSLSLPLLRAVAPDFFDCVRRTTRTLISIPSCVLQSVSSKDGETRVTLKETDLGYEWNVLWKEAAKPEFPTGTRIGVLLRFGKPEAVILHRIWGPQA
jgi:hypothetical protein